MDESRPEPIEIPHHELSPPALRGVIEAWVLREGTEYGARDFTLDEKVAAVMRQLERGDAHILFDAASGAVELALVRELKRPQAARDKT